MKLYCPKSKAELKNILNVCKVNGLDDVIKVHVLRYIHKLVERRSYDSAFILTSNASLKKFIEIECYRKNEARRNGSLLLTRNNIEKVSVHSF